MFFERIRSRLFPTPIERWRRRCEKWLQLANAFEDRFPESVEMLRCAVITPEQFPATYGPHAKIDGKEFPDLFGRIEDPEDIDPEDIFQQVFDWGFKVFAEVDWKISNEEIYLIVDSMLRGYGYGAFDWSFKEDHDDDTTESYQFITVIDEELKGSGYRLVSFDPQGDSHAFAVIPDKYYELVKSIEPYY